MNPFQHARRGAMTAARIARLFASAGGKCQDCRGEGMNRLGRDGVTALHVGFAVGQQ